MELSLLKSVSWQHSQLLYHALPRLGREGLCLLAPETPYVCIGRFQDAEQEVDLAYCRESHIPVFRREVGGGAVYLDGDQLFFQLIIHRDHPLIPPGGKLAFYRKFLRAPIEAYRALGIPAEYREVNDIVANERKISGCGAAEIEGHYVLVGNLIVDFDYETMARVLKVPDEKFRDKVYKTIRENLSTIRRELGYVPPRDELWGGLADAFGEILGPLSRRDAVDEVWQAKAEALGERLMDEAWLLGQSRPQPARAVRVRSGVDVVQRVHKAPGGLIRGTSVVRDGKLATVSLSGDFFFYPEEQLARLEKALEGASLDSVENRVLAFYTEHNIESPSLTPQDFARVLAD